MLKKLNQYTKNHICYILNLILLSQKCLHVLSICNFLHQTLHTIHHFCLPQFPLPSFLLSHGVAPMKRKHYCIQRESMSLCSWSTVVLHCAHSVAVLQTERSSWLLNPSHSVPALTITVLSASCAVHSFTDTHTLPHFSYYRQLKSNFSRTLYLRHTSLYTITFPAPCTSDTHYCTQ